MGLKFYALESALKRREWIWILNRFIWSIIEQIGDYRIGRPMNKSYTTWVWICATHFELFNIFRKHIRTIMLCALIFLSSLLFLVAEFGEGKPLQEALDNVCKILYVKSKYYTYTVKLISIERILFRIKDRRTISHFCLKPKCWRVAFPQNWWRCSTRSWIFLGIGKRRECLEAHKR